MLEVLGFIFEVLMYLLLAVILGLPIAYPIYKIYKWIRTWGKTPCIVLTKGGLVTTWGDLDLDSKVLRVKDRKLSKDEIGFQIDPSHAKNFLMGFTVKRGFFLDLEKRESVDLVQTNNKLNVKEMSKRKLELDYLSRKEFWKARMEVAKMRLSMIIIMLMAGAGLYSLIRMFLSAMGIYVP